MSATDTPLTRGALILVSVLLGTPLPPGHAVAQQAAPPDCAAVIEWADYLNTMIDRQRDLAQREVELTRDPRISTDALADGLAVVAADREVANVEFEAYPAPASALPIKTAFGLAWELNAEIASAYLRAVRSGDERQRGLADGYTEASGTIESRAGRLLNALLNLCTPVGSGSQPAVIHRRTLTGRPLTLLPPSAI